MRASSRNEGPPTNFAHSSEVVVVADHQGGEHSLKRSAVATGNPKDDTAARTKT
jgi:hypothetical protein